jgi:hypothetical protein
MSALVLQVLLRHPAIDLVLLFAPGWMYLGWINYGEYECGQLEPLDLDFFTGFFLTM